MWFAVVGVVTSAEAMEPQPIMAEAAKSRASLEVGMVTFMRGNAGRLPCPSFID